MKRSILSLTSLVIVAIATQCFMSCAQDEPTTAPVNVRVTPPDTMRSVTITFSCAGDFVMSPFPAFTRALEADGKQMTDLWVLDYQGCALVQQVHQTSTDADFGTPTLSLSVGDHHLYFVASRGSGASLDTDAGTLTFSTVRDTFWEDLALSVTASSSGSRTVPLDRCVTKLSIAFTDAIPEGAATIGMTPATWYYGINYLTGEPTAATAAQTITINIPTSYIGQSGLEASIFGFSSATDWQTDISIVSRKSDNTILGQAALTAVPLKRNRVTSYSGPLFSSNGQTTVALSTEWESPVEATW